ncbi:MAG: helix-turn-helix domain-containing protein [Oscillospiraceae bacterium]|nr:helix-turn-helix domain-containing protein [Oscillospiraceae bacterium]
MNLLAEENAAARAMGLTYGRYKALLFKQVPQTTAPKNAQKPPKRNRKRYTDEAAFLLWQQGKSDSQIGAALGVSRQIIQRWRDTLELPSTIKNHIETKKYRLVETQDGFYIIREGDIQIPTKIRDSDRLREKKMI